MLIGRPSGLDQPGSEMVPAEQYLGLVFFVEIGLHSIDCLIPWAVCLQQLLHRAGLMVVLVVSTDVHVEELLVVGVVEMTRIFAAAAAAL